MFVKCKDIAKTIFIRILIHKYLVCGGCYLIEN